MPTDQEVDWTIQEEAPAQQAPTAQPATVKQEAPPVQTVQTPALTRESILAAAEAAKHAIPQPAPAPAPQPQNVLPPITPDMQLRTGLSARQLYEEQQRQENDRLKEDFMRKVLEARNKANAPPPPPQPAPQAVLERTRQEMEEGRRQNEKHAAHYAAHPMPRGHNPMAPETTAVYRPTDHVPNMEQGQVPTQTYKTL